MKLTPAPDDLENCLFHRLESENGLIEMGIYPVLFGFRVGAGFKGSLECEWDWCAGNDLFAVKALYVAAQAILSSRPECRRAFDGVPSCSAIKPAMSDRDFLVQLADAIPEGPDVALYVPDVDFNEIRATVSRFW